jgi:tRNA 2-thiocytidine biosynthesis protein TtcA
VTREEPAAPVPQARGGSKVEHRLNRAMGRAIAEFSMIAEGDRVMCAVSGGKDSYTLHHLLTELAKRAPVRFEIIAVNIDQGHPGFPKSVLPTYMAERGHAFRVVEEDTYAIVTEKIPEGKTFCSLCSRLRRGILYRVARELGCTKIALGHHREDAIGTLLLNLFFSGQLKAMPPKLVSDDGDNVVIRPLIYCAEEHIAELAAERAFPIIPCDLCGSQENLQRKQMSRLLADVETRVPGVRESILAALRNVRPSHLLDQGLWKALGLEVAREQGGGEGAPSTSEGAADAIPAERLVRGPTPR